MSFGDQAVPEEEPVSSEGEAAPAEVNGSAAQAAEDAGSAEEADPRDVLARERGESLAGLEHLLRLDELALEGVVDRDHGNQVNDPIIGIVSALGPRVAHDEPLRVFLR